MKKFYKTGRVRKVEAANNMEPWINITITRIKTISLHRLFTTIYKTFDFISRFVVDISSISQSSITINILKNWISKIKTT